MYFFNNSSQSRKEEKRDGRIFGNDNIVATNNLVIANLLKTTFSNCKLVKC